MEKDTVNNSMKGLFRQICCIIAILMMSAVLTAGQSYAAVKPVDFSFAKEKVRADDLVNGSIVVNSDKVTNGSMTVDYDSSRLRLIKAEKAAGQDSLYISINPEKPGQIIIAFADEAVIEQGSIADLQFKVLAKAEKGDVLRISADMSKIYDDQDRQTGKGEAVQKLVVTGGSGGGDDPSGGGDSGNGGSGAEGGNGSGGDGRENGDAAGTGDDAGYMPIVILAAAVSAGAVFMVSRRKGKDNE